MTTPLNDPVTTLAELREDVRDLIGTRYRDEARKSADEAKAVKHHFDAMVDAVDGVFTDSVPTYLQKTGPNGLDATYAQVDVAPTGTLEGDRTAVIAAALAAKNAGEQTVRLADGDWLLDELTPTDIYDRYLVMDHGTFSPSSWVYPFKPDEWAGMSAYRGSGHNGRIAIEVDDSLMEQWTSLFPLTKRLGIPLSVAWHTGNGAKWIHEAHRHGWEILSHLPADEKATELLTAGTLDAKAQASLDAVRSIVGNIPVGFVYPAHVRSAATDQVLKKYYAWGRGGAGRHMSSPQMPNEWLTSAYPLDTHFTGGRASDTVRKFLRQVSASNSQMVFYLHLDSIRAAGDHGAGLTDMVRYARSLGIDIVTSGQILGDRNINDDPFFTSSGWSLSGGASFSTDTAYHGERSVKFPAPGPGNGWGSVYQDPEPIESSPGRFTKLRVTYRRKNTTPVSFTSSGAGIGVLGVLGYRKRNEIDSRRTSLLEMPGTTPQRDTADLPAGDWVEETADLLLNPSVREIGVGLTFANMLPGGVIHIDDLRIVPAGYTQEYVTKVTMVGINNTFVRTPILDLHTKCHVHIEPERPLAGTMSVTPSGLGRLLLKSTDPADTMQITVRVTPRDVWYDDE